jgi:hypothetical protein
MFGAVRGRDLACLDQYRPATPSSSRGALWLRCTTRALGTGKALVLAEAVQRNNIPVRGTWCFVVVVGVVVMIIIGGIFIVVVFG